MILITVQGDMQLAGPAAAAWERLRDHAAAVTGLRPILSSPAGAWRSEDLVVDMWYHPARYGASQGVARPISLGGDGSVHQNGLCVDINNWRAFGGLELHRGFWRSSILDGLCAAHGFRMDPRYPNEPWHYQHNGIAPAGGDATRFEQGDDMLAVTILAPKDDPVRYLYYPGGTARSRYLDGGTRDAAIAALVYKANSERVVEVDTKAEAQALVDLANAAYAELVAGTG